jgi:hypothetical protein
MAGCDGQGFLVSLGFLAEVDKVCTAASSFAKISKLRVT